MAYLLHQLLEKSAQNYPDITAIIDLDKTVTYRELDALANQLANALKNCGVCKGDRVGICLERSLECIAAIYGILKAGAAYVPLDPSAPDDRTGFCIENCQIKVLVTTNQKLISLSKYEDNKIGKYINCAIVTDSRQETELTASKVITWDEVLASSPELIPVSAIDADIAHILYTSGSTGQPKGVMASHRYSLNFASCFYECLQVQPGERMTHQLPIYFGASIVDLFTIIQAAATMVIVPSELLFFPSELAAFIEAQRINLWFAVPSTLTQVVLRGNLDKYRLPDLRAIMFGGEVFQVKYLRQLIELLPHVKYCNIYGSTETGARTYYLFDQLSPEMQVVPLGKACENSELFMVNDSGEVITTPEEIGELYARGSSVMKGYWGLPEKTAEVLVPYTLHEYIGEEIVFRTGDMVKRDAAGNYVYVGRRDRMIKSRGYRIELGEIETIIHNHPQVEEVAAIAIPDDEIGNRIKAVVVPRQGSNLQKIELQSFCNQYLPKYMIPEIIEFSQSLPKTPTGKIDRVSLAKCSNPQS
ncbi:MAG TPA: D-alanine--poly(phosphoribitol) ligase [Cyanobacteria bacterium UBA8803]|nr:D-alanine--poly(phosphoribitol) ligase [Cyanobacteria bacterium UBA9273]HBL59090.1 D-alanine--poly(phosphoribitol) ligase [Cyanobacteria bacterium UBA8803]